ncbi:MAG: hypothetical protein ACYC91_02365 [Solirubrobacteraceae bacterium]
MSIPAIEVGLDLDQRVVRRHAAKLEAAAGWLGSHGSGAKAALQSQATPRLGISCIYGLF